ncbi:MAG: YigZ family protein [Clostridium sp.]|jgi:uncharacterized YigZ family protein|nr:YigZ family protein [Clostridium sp.]
MSYTVRKEGIGEYTEKKSVFVGRIRRCTSEEEARAFIDEIRKKERTARHHVFAYVIGEEMPTVRYSDDGEPQGTGGLPVLNVLNQHELSNVCLVVTRFFGGILLGAPGLTRAYGKAAVEAVNSVDHWQVVEGVSFSVSLPYDIHARLKAFLDGIQVLSSEFGQDVTLNLLTTLGDEEDLMNSLTDLSGGKAEFSETKTAKYFLRRDGLLEEVKE